MNKDNIQELKLDNKVVCIDCGVKYLTANQKIRAAVCTFHEGECCVCGKIKSVTSIRHYNYLNQTNQP